MICNPEAVVMGFPVVWADAGVTKAARENESARNLRRCMIGLLIERSRRTARALITERATILAWIGAAGERALVPVDPDALPAAERRDKARGLVTELLQAFDGCGRHAVLELIDALVVQAARHIDRFLDVAAIVEDVGHHMTLPDRLVLAAHHAERHLRAAVPGDQAGNDGVQRPLARRDAVGMTGLDAEAAGAVLQEDARLVGDDCRAEGMRDRVDE